MADLDVDVDRYRRAARILHDVAKPMRVLSALKWPGELRESFLAGGGTRLPQPTYAPIDPATPLDLATRVHTAIDELHHASLIPPVRRDAMFTDNDAAQLLNHEAFIHVATGLNGRAQKDMPILAIGHPGTTRTQEGLAVFSEYVSGTLELDRLRRLADRVFAVQMVVDGGDFIETYRWFSERSAGPEQAFESTRRIFRGAPLSGGAPFTKDCVYISGFLAVSTLVRAAFAAKRSDTLVLLFAGKLDLTAIPALAELRSRGMCEPARFVPPWAGPRLAAEPSHLVDLHGRHRPRCGDAGGV